VDQRTQTALTEKLLAHLDAGTTDLADGLYENPVDIYTCADRLHSERERLFRRFPIAMGLSGLLPEPNTYFTDDYAGVPILLTRDADGTAHAFLNVCRHRGARIADGKGDCGKALTCPYHGWAYRADGVLAGVPDRRNFAGMSEQRESLSPLPLVERDGVLWVALDPDGNVDIDAHLEGLAPELANYDLGGYHLYKTTLLEHDMNWKIAIDTFLEPYHFGVLHKHTVASVFEHNLCLVDGFGPHLREVLPRQTISELREQPKDQWDLLTHSAVVYLLFPNTALVYQIDHVELFRIFPDGDNPDKCKVLLEFYVPQPAMTESARGHWDRNLDLTLRTVQFEDFPAGEGIQKGLRTGAQSSFVYGRNEPALQYYHRQLRDILAAV